MKFHHIVSRGSWWSVNLHFSVKAIIDQKVVSHANTMRFHGVSYWMFAQVYVLQDLNHLWVITNFDCKKLNMEFLLDMNISLPIIIVSDIPIVVVTNLSTLGALFRHLKSPLKNYFNSLLLEDLFIKIKRKPMSLRTELHRIIVTKYRSSRLQRYKNSCFFYKT